MKWSFDGENIPIDLKSFVSESQRGFYLFSYLYIYIHTVGYCYNDNHYSDRYTRFMETNIHNVNLTHYNRIRLPTPIVLI